jgi:hypothetical protein
MEVLCTMILRRLLFGAAALASAVAMMTSPASAANVTPLGHATLAAHVAQRGGGLTPGAPSVEDWGCSGDTCVFFDLNPGGGYHGWANLNGGWHGHVDIWGPGISFHSGDGFPPFVDGNGIGQGNLCAQGWSFDGVSWHSHGLACVWVNT